MLENQWPHSDPYSNLLVYEQEEIQLALYSKHTQSLVPRILSAPYSIPTYNPATVPVSYIIRILSMAAHYKE